MKKFTVVVLYPKRLQERGQKAPQTYTAFVEASDCYRARDEGREQAWRKQPPEDRGFLAGWQCLVVFEGHQQPVAFGWQA